MLENSFCGIIYLRSQSPVSLNSSQRSVAGVSVELGAEPVSRVSFHVGARSSLVSGELWSVSPLWGPHSRGPYRQMQENPESAPEFLCLGGYVFQIFAHMQWPCPLWPTVSVPRCDRQANMSPNFTEHASVSPLFPLPVFCREYNLVYDVCLCFFFVMSNQLITVVSVGNDGLYYDKNV